MQRLYFHAFHRYAAFICIDHVNELVRRFSLRCRKAHRRAAVADVLPDILRSMHMPQGRVGKSAEHVGVDRCLRSDHPVMLRDRLMSHQYAPAVSGEPRLFEHPFQRVGHGEKLLAIRRADIGKCDIRKHCDIYITERFYPQRLLLRKGTIDVDTEP